MAEESEQGSGVVVSGIADPWDDYDDEYQVLKDLVAPAAVQRYYNGQVDWSAFDTKALGILAIDAAALAVLIAIHDVVHRLWWIPGGLLGIAGGLLIAAVYPRAVADPPNLLELHDVLRDELPLSAAREFVNDFEAASDANDRTMGDKTTLLWLALALLVIGLLGCLPVSLLHPG